MGPRRYREIWTPRIGETAARHQYRAQWLMTSGGVATLIFVLFILLASASDKGGVHRIGIVFQIAAATLICLGVIEFLVSIWTRRPSP